jgi:flagellar assembly protein FliH
MRAREQADEIILDAQKTADNLLAQAQDEIDHQKKEATRQGLDEAHREIESTLQASHALVTEVQAWQKELMAQGEQILVEMVKEISQTMFGEGAKLDANALQVNLNRVMESAQGLGDLNVFLNPRDARLLDPSWSEYQLLITGDKVKVIPSENITPGGCFVKGSMGSVDARVETQLAAVIKSLEENKEASE